MKILEQFPPNYALIKVAFPAIENHKPIFCYGDTIYNPFKITITADLDAHEAVHSNQQGDNPETWWNRYCTDPQFRLEQEIEAYGVQYKFIQDKKIPSKLFEWIKDRMVSALSGGVYGNLLTYGEAESKIRNYAKKI